MSLAKILGSLIIGLVMISSSCDPQKSNQKKSFTKEELLEANRDIVNSESDKIDRYEEYAGLNMKKTSTGLRYSVYHDSEGKSPKKGSLATLTYKSYLLDSTLVGDTDVTGALRFRVEQDDVPSGLHEAVMLLNAGDSARVILPPHLAYGLTGTEKIPPNATLYYDLCLVSIR
ncbi:MAG: FKBP-type peptidyl-prolyl cis-trans isomerase [Cryomorphaceae bacterium]|nr:FKBP-type peptidyl-prolyl cis-trans isomerase [Flavobacteriales bacterium]